MRVAIAQAPGRCSECDCRFRPGELIISLADLCFHTDCFRTRGLLRQLPDDEFQHREMDRLLAVIQAEEIVLGQRT
ncbi:MAG TPA: hypothetical protein VMV93_14790 [Chloroflexota bacterium]|nr:hypothetical protein [Chloroflexota bacterium]